MMTSKGYLISSQFLSEYFELAFFQLELTKILCKLMVM